MVPKREKPTSMSALQSPSVACFATQSLFAGSCASPPSSGLPLLPTAVRSDVGQNKTKRETFGRCVLSLQKMKHRKHRAETPRSNQRPVICRQTLDPPAASRAVRSQSSCVSRSSLCPHHAQRLSQMNEPSNKVRCAGKRCGSRKMAPSLPTLIISPDRSMTKKSTHPQARSRKEFVTLNRALPRKLDATAATHPASPGIPCPGRGEYAAVFHQSVVET